MDPIQKILNEIEKKEALLEGVLTIPQLIEVANKNLEQCPFCKGGKIISELRNAFRMDEAATQTRLCSNEQCVTNRK